MWITVPAPCRARLLECLCSSTVAKLTTNHDRSEGSGDFCHAALASLAA